MSAPLNAFKPSRVFAKKKIVSKGEHDAKHCRLPQSEIRRRAGLGDLRGLIHSSAARLRQRR
jgi:hypothetical protein